MPPPPDPYRSHLFVLYAVVGMLQPKRILEFGAGIYSTPFFLGLPGLRRLVSIERDPDWYARIAEQFTDKRLVLMADDPPAPADYDLVFIDDGKCPEDREQTIRWVLGQPHPMVVIHDAEVAEYGAVIRELAREPATAVVW